MTISPVALGIGGGAAALLAVGVGTTAIADGIAKRNPTGSEADGKARLVQGSMIAAGFASVVGGGFALMRGNVGLGAALLGTGAGAMLGAAIGAVAFQHRHGIGVDTAVDDVISAYDRDGDKLLDLSPGWRTPENVRRERHEHEDGDGDVHYTYTTYTIDELTNRADADQDGRATRPELRSVIASFDGDGNGRLQGDEAARMQREVGERSWYGGWY